jgi:hypothetical protein
VQATPRCAAQHLGDALRRLARSGQRIIVSVNHSVEGQPIPGSRRHYRPWLTAQDEPCEEAHVVLVVLAQTARDLGVVGLGGGLNWILTRSRGRAGPQVDADPLEQADRVAAPPRPSAANADDAPRMSGGGNSSLLAK